MAKIAPDQLLPNYTADASTITLSITDLPGLTADEIAADTGNMGEVLRVLLDELAKAYDALAPEAKDGYWIITKNNASIAPGGDGLLRETYSPRFDSEITDKNLAEG